MASKRAKAQPPPVGTPPAPLARLMLGATVLGAALLGLFVLWYGARPLGAGDVFWQVRTGEITLDTGTVPSFDTFSYTIQGTPWNNHEWLFEILAALLYRAVGWNGFRAFVLLLFGGSLAGIGWVTKKRAGPAAALLVVALEVIFSAYKALPVPQLLSMVLFLVALAAFRGRSLVSAPRAPLLLGLYLLLWGNLTAEALSFLPIVVIDQVCLRRARTPQPPLQRLAVALFVLALVAPLINPPWASTLDYALSGTAVNRVANSEFAHLWERANAIDQIAKDIAIGLILVYLPWVARRLSQAADRWEALRQAAPALIGVFAAIELERNLWLLVLPAMDLAEGVARWAADHRTRQLASAAGLISLAAILFTLWVPRGWTPLLALRNLTSTGYWAESLGGALPLDCMEPVVSAPAGTRLFTLRSWSGYVIWRAHQVQVFGDGRNLEYPLELFYAGNEAWEGGPRAQEVLDKTGTQMVLAYPGWSKRPGVVTRDWRETRRGARCAVYERLGGS